MVLATSGGVRWVENLDPCYTDADGDGVGTDLVPCSVAGAVRARGDCEEGDPRRFPGALETCDGVDEDCTGEADDPVDVRTWYYDDDGDGYGGTAAATTTCGDPPRDHVLDRGDCDVWNADVHPNQAEVPCTRLDEDCDGRTDDRADVDGDGAVCDCDESDPGVRAGTPERCDGLDQDCDGRVDDGLPAADGFEDADGDGVGGAPLATCDAVGVRWGGDCDDSDPRVAEDCSRRRGGGGPSGCGCATGGDPRGVVFLLGLLMSCRLTRRAPRR